MPGKLIRYIASMLPLPLGFRAAIYRLSGMRIGKNVVIDRDLQVTKAENITIGDRVTVSKSVSLLGEVTAVNSRLNAEFNVRKSAPVIIEDDVFIGVKVTILPGCTVGRMSTIGSNSVVMADVPAYAVVMGVPGRVLMIRRKEKAAE
ncbi:MAG: acyltransferase [Candidatus Eisenbacteria bacterium]